MAIENSQKHYGDVIKRVVIIDIPGGATDEAISNLLAKEGLRPAFEWVDAGYLLWLPDSARYTTKTKPKRG